MSSSARARPVRRVTFTVPPPPAEDPRQGLRLPLPSPTRSTPTGPPADGRPVIADVRAAAALECLWIVLGQWSANGGREDLGELLDAAFAAFSAPARA